MKNCILSVLFFCFSLAVFSQDIYTKDGVKLGDRSVFINSCVKGFEKETIDLNGITVNKNNYCSCVCDNLMPKLTSTEIFVAMQSNDMQSLFLKDKNFKILMDCVEDHMKVEDHYVFKEDNFSDMDKLFAVKSCVDEMMVPNDDYIWTKAEAEEYCECAMENLYSKGYTFKDLMQASDEDSKAFNEIVIPCLTKIFNPESTSAINQFPNTYVKNDIIGSSLFSEIKLIDYLGQGYKIKIEIDGLTKYFLFDTGASDLIIDRDFERDLLINGSINKGSYVGKGVYIMANNQEVVADIIKVNNLKIGDYTLNNVHIAVIEEGGMLCGKSLFDKFKTWRFQELDHKIVLFK